MIALAFGVGFLTEVAISFCSVARSQWRIRPLCPIKQIGLRRILAA
jgi:hypothetical protein